MDYITPPPLKSQAIILTFPLLIRRRICRNTGSMGRIIERSRQAATPKCKKLFKRLNKHQKQIINKIKRAVTRFFLSLFKGNHRD
ncbi:hypothetical protein M5J15_10065 [Serratia symbiotica]|uniref:hypothetical protein n=1 Tax=Serratia symbiotica TaxID=138074 RepID=UPI0020912CE5|nr:hypothetical protein [Serratia symbiotica]USS95035.1 hypothetical protein M5J15_10065 [Serratia symbiotica]